MIIKEIINSPIQFQMKFSLYLMIKKFCLLKFQETLLSTAKSKNLIIYTKYIKSNLITMNKIIKFHFSYQLDDSQITINAIKFEEEFSQKKKESGQSASQYAEYLENMIESYADAENTRMHEEQRKKSQSHL